VRLGRRSGEKEQRRKTGDSGREARTRDVRQGNRTGDKVQSRETGGHKALDMDEKRGQRIG
jgi:hypothetical protein